MEINVGEYVRTKHGIAKYIKDINTKTTIYKMLDKKIVWDNVEDWEDIISDSDIIKHSKDIIDLVEVGDYVNGRLVCNVGKGNKYIYLVDFPDLINIKANDEIRTVLTKEQFEANAYTIEKER